MFFMPFGSGGLCVCVVSWGCLFLVCLALGFAWGWVGLCGLVFWALYWLFPGCLVGVLLVLFGEFDPGSGRTLAACLTHASRTVKRLPIVVGVDEWRTGE